MNKAIFLLSAAATADPEPVTKTILVGLVVTTAVTMAVSEVTRRVFSWAFGD